MELPAAVSYLTSWARGEIFPYLLGEPALAPPPPCRRGPGYIEAPNPILNAVSTTGNRVIPLTRMRFASVSDACSSVR